MNDVLFNFSSPLRAWFMCHRRAGVLIAGIIIYAIYYWTVKSIIRWFDNRRKR